MKKMTRKMVYSGSLVLFGIYLGISLSHAGTSGNSNENRAVPAYAPLYTAQTDSQPYDGSQYSPPSAYRQPSQVMPAANQQAPASGQRQTSIAKRSQAVQQPERLVTQDSRINHLGNKAGDLLQIIAHHSMKSVVSLLGHVL